MNWNKSLKANLKLNGTVALLLAGILFSHSGHATDSYQYKVLFSPTDAVIEAEDRGRIMIYDGMPYATVMRAMDEHFNRIENMMFVRTVHIQDNGEIEVGDDCD